MTGEISTAEAAQPKNEPEESPLSPWWIRPVLIVMVGSFAGLLTITELAYRNAPPIPGRVVDADGTTVFTGDGAAPADWEMPMRIRVRCWSNVLARAATQNVR